MDKPNDSQSAIASSVEEQTATTNEITKAMGDAAQGTKGIASNVASVATAAKDTSAGASQAEQSARDLGKVSGELERLMQQFKLQDEGRGGQAHSSVRKQAGREEFVHAMVIDDSRATRKILGNMLRDLGFEVSEARHGREALERLAEQGEVELALVDWNMPEMNGFDFVSEVRSKPDYDDICLMMVTTETEMEQVIKAIEAGANEYVMKPFTKEIIAEKLQMVGLIS